LCPATTDNQSTSTSCSGGASSPQGLLGLSHSGIRLGERRLSLGQRLFRRAWSRGCCCESNRRLCAKGDGSGSSATRSDASWGVASGYRIQYGRRQR
jgi:hypothetical protein